VKIVCNFQDRLKSSIVDVRIVCVSSASEQQCHDCYLWRLARVRNRRRQAAHKLKLNSSAASASPWHHTTWGFETAVDVFDAVAHLARRCTIGFLEGPELQNRVCNSAKGPFRVWSRPPFGHLLGGTDHTSQIRTRRISSFLDLTHARYRELTYKKLAS
jgi:hypothetical protein